MILTSAHDLVQWQPCVELGCEQGARYENGLCDEHELRRRTRAHRDALDRLWAEIDKALEEAA